MKRRLFLAIPLSDSLLQKFIDLKARYGLETDIRWTENQNLHITVYFFGDVLEEKIGLMSKKIAEVVAVTPAFNLKLEKIILAPPQRPARMIWAQFAKSEEYSKLVMAINSATREFLDPRSAQETDRDQIPHITLARFQNPAAAKNLSLEPVNPEEMAVTNCVLNASELTPKGSTYAVLEKYAFLPVKTRDSLL
jgi:2'-5' RNA ligase